MEADYMRTVDEATVMDADVLRAVQHRSSKIPVRKLLPYLIELALMITILGVNISLIESSCNRVFQSNGETTAPGLFEAPSRVGVKSFKASINDTKANVSSHNTNASRIEYKPMHCLYKFIGQEHERIVLNFSSFRLRGDEPECLDEYVDIYIKLKPEDDLANAMSNEPPNGRFCTTITPRRMVSLHNMLVLAIYSELEPPTDRRPIFAGSFEFIKSKPYDQIGPPNSNTLCDHTIRSYTKREGEFQSVTYPGVYVKALKCSYKFIGEPEQRIRLEFLDLDVYSGGSHCPLDSVKVFDGLDETDPIINTICGSHRSLIIYSTKETMLVTFSTLQREAEIQNRGFSAYFEFSEKFFDTSFIQGFNAKHIRGSECDQRVISYKETSGIIVSPESKNHPNAICRYVFEGLQTSQDYEKVLLKFIDFDLKTPRYPSVTASSSTTPVPVPVVAQSTSSLVGVDANATISGNATECTDNYVRLYTGEQKDPNDYDYIFCGNMSDIPQNIESDAASLLMEYNSGSLGGSFKAEYLFIVDYRIPGLQTPPGCNYVYRSDNLKTGVFNSPRNPSWYINDMNCTYTFMTKNEEAVLFQFNTFNLANSFNGKVLGYNDACNGEDLVQIFELTLDQADQKVLNQTEIGTYCGTTTPGPILSYKPVRIIFQANKEQVHYGFSAVYSFFPVTALKTNEFVTNCGGQIYSSQRNKSGSIASPDTYRSETYEKRNHICSWNITARPSHRIALDFTHFELEGSPSVRGCITASVRIITGRARRPTEICGTISSANGLASHFISDNEWLSLTFISTKQASGSNGFSATWTEVKRQT